jgi:hypothetical protein
VKVEEVGSSEASEAVIEVDQDGSFEMSPKGATRGTQRQKHNTNDKKLTLLRKLITRGIVTAGNAIAHAKLDDPAKNGKAVAWVKLCLVEFDLAMELGLEGVLSSTDLHECETCVAMCWDILGDLELLPLPGDGDGSTHQQAKERSALVSKERAFQAIEQFEGGNATNL